ncbi:hypothetical protein ABZ816_33555 [Actinosynnema sp. NPDC047251]|nr:hypothetical protein [Saccharothrix espanaensis]
MSAGLGRIGAVTALVSSVIVTQGALSAVVSSRVGSSGTTSVAK